MRIAITRRDDGRFDVALGPHEGPDWRSPSPLTATEVLRHLSALGCHSTDGTDALYAADPSWADGHDAEALRQRGDQSS